MKSNAFAAFLMVIIVASFWNPPPARAPQSAYALKPTCTDSLQNLIDTVAPGTNLRMRTDCIYRESIAIEQPVSLDGLGGAEIRGSDIWTNWTQQGSLWVSDEAAPTFVTHGRCAAESNDRCLGAEQVFFDGNPLFQVAEGRTPISGQFALDDSGHVVLADDPTGAIVEVTMRTKWVNVARTANVTIQGLTMRHAASAAQAGALRIERGASNIVISNSSIADAHGVNVSVADASDVDILYSDIYNGGQLGISVHDATNVRVIGNKIHHNNTEAFNQDWEAGAIKITRSTRTEFVFNTSYNNNGPGYWCDIDCNNAIVARNDIHHNGSAGIFFEISDTATIFGNRVWENNWHSSHRGWGFEAGILISSSRNAEVLQNTVAWNGDGIIVISQCRAHHADDSTCDTSHRWNNVSGNSIHRNYIIMADDPIATDNVFPLGWLRDITDENDESYKFMYSDAAANRGGHNAYWVPQPEGSTKNAFSWGGSSLSLLTDFNMTDGEDDGYYLSDAQKDEVLIAAGIPSAPEDHAVPRDAYQPLTTMYSSTLPNPAVTHEPGPAQAPIWMKVVMCPSSWCSDSSGSRR